MAAEDDDDDDRSTRAPRRIRLESKRLSASVLRQALRQREREGCTLAFHLALCGVVSPGELVLFLHELTGFPIARADELAALGTEVTRGFPEELLFDGAMLPMRILGDVATIAMCDPLAPGLLRDTRLFATARVEPRILGLDQMALHYPRVCGRYWRMRPDQLDGGALAELSDEARALLAQAHALEGELSEASQGEDLELLIELHAGGEPETFALSRARRTAAATLDRAGEPILTEAERPRIAGKGHGASRHYLDPVQEGEAVLLSESPAPRVDQDAPKIIIDMDLLEAEAEPAPKGPTSSSVIIDPSLFELPSEDPPEPPPPPPPEPERKVAIPRQIQLGRLNDDAASASDDELGDIDIDIDLDSTEFPTVDSESTLESEWLALSSELDAALDLEALDWPFDPSLDGPSAPAPAASGFERTSSHATRKVLGPASGEAVVSGTSGGGREPTSWFDPRTERSSGARVSDALRTALRQVATAETHEETFLGLASVLSAVYERGIVLRLEGDRAVALAYDGPRAQRRWIDEDNGAPAVSVTEFDALGRLAGEPGKCFEGRLPQPAALVLDGALPGGPATRAIVCPIALSGRVVLLLYADAGPGRDAERQPELWRLLMREVPRALLRLNVLRKRSQRWELKG